jgi:SulP family sulfate permease
LDNKLIRLEKLFPFLVWLPMVNRQSLVADFWAGLTGAIVVLPQGIAYALIAGMPAEYGLYTAVIVPVIASFFGSSRHMISGPAAAISIVIMSVASDVTQVGTPEFISTVLTLTLLVGVIQFTLGMLRMGVLVNFISHTVVVGFTAGAAILIGTSQIPYVLGVSQASNLSFVDAWVEIVGSLSRTDYVSLSIALVTVATTLISKRVSKKIPAMFVGMIVSMVYAWVIGAVEQGVKFVGAVPDGVPSYSLPDLNINLVSDLLPGAFALAILGLVEAISIGRSVSLKSGQRIMGNQEFLGQGLGNAVGSLFGGFASSGSFTRSGVNYNAGAQTPIAALIAAVLVLSTILFVPQLTAYLPIPAMGGAVMLIAWNLVDTHHIKEILRFNRSEAGVLLVTFIATLFVQLEFAIYLGVILSMVTYLKRTSKPNVMQVAPQSIYPGTDLRSVKRFNLNECPGIRFLRIDGSIFFGATDHILNELDRYVSRFDNCRYLVLSCASVNFIDLAGAQMLVELKNRLAQQNCKLAFVLLKNSVFDELVKSGSASALGEGSFFATPDAALDALVVDEQVKTQCDSCKLRVFRQCP